jgi:hypothetical protein
MTTPVTTVHSIHRVGTPQGGLTHLCRAAGRTAGASGHRRREIYPGDLSIGELLHPPGDTALL